MSLEKLFSPCELKGLSLRNRIVMAPMTRYHSPGGVLGEPMHGYYLRRAQAEIGMIISEATGIARPGALNHPDVPQFHGEQPIAAWKRVAQDVAAAGCVMAPQFWHVGAVDINMPENWPPEGPLESPSGWFSADRQVGVTMTEEAIADAVDAYAKASATAKAIGFPCVEIHAAHGYLIDQFFWGVTNRRTDGYGGETDEARMRFAADVLRATRAAVGPDYPILIRLSQWKQQDYDAKLAQTPSALEKWLTTLMDAGADIFHCSQRRFWEPEFEGSDLNFAGWAKKLTGAPTITVGSIGLQGDIIDTIARGEGSKTAPLDELLRRLDRDEFDLVAVGRALLQDPLWAVKVKEDRQAELEAFDAASMGHVY